MVKNKKESLSLHLPRVSGSPMVKNTLETFSFSPSQSDLLQVIKPSALQQS